MVKITGHVGAVVLLSCLAGLHALDNGLSITPHMGYNTWNCFYGSSKRLGIPSLIC